MKVMTLVQSGGGGCDGFLAANGHRRSRIRHGDDPMQKLTMVVLLTAAMAVPAFAAKLEGNTLLKDFQPAGVGDKHAKKSKHQVFDVTFDNAGKEYVCRTDADKSIDAVDFVVGSTVHY